MAGSLESPRILAVFTKPKACCPPFSQPVLTPLERQGQEDRISERDPKKESRRRTTYTQVQQSPLSFFSEFPFCLQLNGLLERRPKVLDHTQETEKEEESVPLEAMRAAGPWFLAWNLSKVFLTVLCESRLKEREEQTVGQSGDSCNES